MMHRRGEMEKKTVITDYFLMFWLSFFLSISLDIMQKKKKMSTHTVQPCIQMHKYACVAKLQSKNYVDSVCSKVRVNRTR